MTFYSWTRSLASSIPRACHARTTLTGNRVHVRNRESVLGVSSRSHPPVFTLSPSLLKGKWPWSRPLCYLNALLKLFTTRRHCVRLHRRLWAGEGICSTGLLPCCCCVQSSGILPCFALTVVFSTAFRTAKVCVWFFNYVRLIFCPISCSFTDLWLRVTVSAKLWYNDRFRPTGEQTRVNLGRIFRSRTLFREATCNTGKCKWARSHRPVVLLSQVSGWLDSFTSRTFDSVRVYWIS